MGFLSRLFGLPETRTVPARPLLSAVDALKLRSTGGYPLACVGESQYQGTLESICPRTRDGVRTEVTATLILDEDNPHDENAVRVTVDGETVAYLARADAALYRRRLASLSPGVATTTCRAQIRGGWDRGADDRGRYGIWLDLPI